MGKTNMFVLERVLFLNPSRSTTRCHAILPNCQCYTIRFLFGCLLKHLNQVCSWYFKCDYARLRSFKQVSCPSSYKISGNLSTISSCVFFFFIQTFDSVDRTLEIPLDVC